MRIAYGEEQYTGQEAEIVVPLREHGWYHVRSEVQDISTKPRLRRTEFRGDPVTRMQMMRVLADLKYLMIRARYHSEQIEGRYVNRQIFIISTCILEFILITVVITFFQSPICHIGGGRIIAGWRNRQFSRNMRVSRGIHGNVMREMRLGIRERADQRFRSSGSSRMREMRLQRPRGLLRSHDG